LEKLIKEMLAKKQEADSSSIPDQSSQRDQTGTSQLDESTAFNLML
jgi:hypothetical protein